MGYASQQTGIRIIELLRKHQPEFVSGVEMAAILQISRKAVQTQIRNLRADGYVIESRRGNRHRLLPPADVPDAAAVRPLLTTTVFGHSFFFAHAVDSTNTWAMRLAAHGAAQGTVVVADAQDHGKGRCGRNWFSVGGRNLYFSLILYPDIKPHRITELPIVMGTALARGLNEHNARLDCRVKWPNDILCRGRKIAGILCETEAVFDKARHVVIGTGINVNINADEFPVALQADVTSLRGITGERTRRPALLARLLRHMEQAYIRWRTEGLTPFATDWPHLSAHNGETVSLSTDTETITGRSMGITAAGALILLTEDNTRHHIRSGDVTLRRANASSGGRLRTAKTNRNPERNHAP